MIKKKKNREKVHSEITILSELGNSLDEICAIMVMILTSEVEKLTVNDIVINMRLKKTPQLLLQKEWAKNV